MCIRDSFKTSGRDLETYFNHFECDAVLLRPDKYIFDIINFDDNDNLDQIISDVIIQLKSKEIL